MTTTLAIAAGQPVPANFTAISVSAAGVALTIAGLLKWRPLSRLDFLIPWLCLTAGIGLAAAFMRGWAAAIGSAARESVPVVGVALAVGVALVLLFIVLYDLYPGHPTNNLTAVAAVLLPAFGPEIGGLAGTSLASALSWLAVAGASIIATAFGV